MKKNATSNKQCILCYPINSICFNSSELNCELKKQGTKNKNSQNTALIEQINDSLNQKITLGKLNTFTLKDLKYFQENQASNMLIQKSISLNGNNFQIFNQAKEKNFIEDGKYIKDNLIRIEENSNNAKSFIGHDDKEKSSISLSSRKKMGSQFTLMKRKSFASNANPSKVSIQSKMNKLLVLEFIPNNIVNENDCLKKIEINPHGLINSLRKIKDNTSYFGSKASIENEELNDYTIPFPNSGIENRHFMVKYIADYDEYFIKNLSLKAGTFVKVNRKIDLKNSDIISYNDCHLIVNLKFDTHTKNGFSSRLSLTLNQNGVDGCHTYHFSSNDSPIKFGRDIKCNIHINLNNISKIQTTFTYENNVWIIYDGEENHPSTNGTWIFLDDFFKIFDQMTFKAGNLMLKASLIE